MPVQHKTKRGMRKLAKAARNLPVILIGGGALLCVDLYTAAGIFSTTTGELNLFGFAVSVAALKIGFTFGSGFLGFLGSAAAAEFKADPRPEVRAKAGAARIASLLLMVIPMVMFANALAVPAQRAAREAYIASEVYAIDQAMARGSCFDTSDVYCSVSDQQMAEAIMSLRQADEVRTARMDATWFTSALGAAFVYGLLWWSGSAFRRPAPETPWEAKERLRQERAAKARATREANLKAAKKSGWGIVLPFNRIPDVRKLIATGRG